MLKPRAHRPPDVRRSPILIFRVALAAIAVVGWRVHTATGSTAYLLDTRVFDLGETVLWRDDRRCGDRAPAWLTSV
jgi:hypothetical protein